jgi:hypothetical protein
MTYGRSETRMSHEPHGLWQIPQTITGCDPYGEIPNLHSKG